VRTVTPDAEKLGLRSDTDEFCGNTEVQRQNPYLSARSCFKHNYASDFVWKEPLDSMGNYRARQMIVTLLNCKEQNSAYGMTKMKIPPSKGGIFYCYVLIFIIQFLL